MRQLALVVACLASLGHGRRAQPSALQTQRRPISGGRQLLKASSPRPEVYDHSARNGPVARPSEASGVLQGSESEHDTAGTMLELRGGYVDASDAVLTAANTCNQLIESLVGFAAVQVAEMRKTLEKGSSMPGFGVVAELIMTEALDNFDAETPPGAAEEVAKLYEEKRKELSAALLKNIEPVFAQQVCRLADAALKVFKEDLLHGYEGSEALAKAEDNFMREASASVPTDSGFSFKFQCASLVSSMRAILTEHRKAMAAVEDSTEEIQIVRSYVEMQQEQMGALQADFPTEIGWDVAATFHPPDTDINFASTYEPGVCEVQVSMASDDKKDKTILGDNGFTSGIGPANLGFSFNIHL